MLRLSNRQVFIEATSAFFILLFTYTGTMKLADLRGLELAISQTGLYFQSAHALAIGLAMGELIISVALLLPKTRRAGLVASFILMTAFSLYIGIMLLFSSKLSCNCGGIVSTWGWKTHLVFNILCTGLALEALIQDRKIGLSNSTYYSNNQA